MVEESLGTGVEPLDRSSLVTWSISEHSDLAVTGIQSDSSEHSLALPMEVHCYAPSLP